jgi:hypothetical protein
VGSPPTLSPAPARVPRRARGRSAPRAPDVARRLGGIPTSVQLALIVAVAAALRLFQLDRVGFNSDEAVYVGQAGSIAEDPALEPFFPVFRAHPLLFQTFLSVGFRLGLPDGFERLTAAAVGVVTVWLVYELGRLLYGPNAGLLGALFVALMPYHVVVTRQVLLDGPMTLFATLTLVLLARFAKSGRPAWLYGAGAAMGLTFLSKESSIILLGAVYAFLALTPQLRVRLRDLAISMSLMGLVIAPFPLTLMLAGRTGTGESYLTWQLFRKPNHDWLFYPTTVPEAIGPLVLLAAGLGLWLLRREASWRETLLLCWVVVPVVFFQLWLVKGFQYLLPVAPAIAVLAARGITRTNRRPALLAAAIVAASLLVPTWEKVAGVAHGAFLAGSGGLPAGREAGRWIDANVPPGARFMTIGPSMANLIQFYGRRKAYGLSVSPNPLNRNPSYEPLVNPDRVIRDSELQYVVWDTFSAARSPHFASKLRQYASRYNGRVVHSQLLEVPTDAGKLALRPAIVVFEVRP